MRAGGVRSVPPQQATAQSPASARRHAQRSAANDGIRPHLSENLERNAGAGLGIGQRMVVVFEVEAAAAATVWSWWLGRRLPKMRREARQVQ